MKKYTLPVVAALLAISCNKIEEKIDQTVQKTTEAVQEKAQKVVEETVKKTVDESINSLTNSKDAQFNEVFPGSGTTMVTEAKERNLHFLMVRRDIFSNIKQIKQP